MTFFPNLFVDINLQLDPHSSFFCAAFIYLTATRMHRQERISKWWHFSVEIADFNQMIEKKMRLLPWKKLSGLAVHASPLTHSSLTNTTGGMKSTGTYLHNWLRNRFVEITEEIAQRYIRALQGR